MKRANGERRGKILMRTVPYDSPASFVFVQANVDEKMMFVRRVSPDRSDSRYFDKCHALDKSDSSSPANRSPRLKVRLVPQAGREKAPQIERRSEELIFDLSLFLMSPMSFVRATADS